MSDWIIYCFWSSGIFVVIGIVAGVLSSGDERLQEEAHAGAWMLLLGLSLFLLGCVLYAAQCVWTWGWL